MEFGNVTKSLDVDLSGSDSNEAIFHLFISREYTPDTLDAEIMFYKVFES